MDGSTKLPGKPRFVKQLHTTPRPQQEITKISGLSLSDKVQFAVSRQSGYPLHAVITQENKEKYYDSDNPYSADDNLTEVFGLMRELNRQALSNPDLCRISEEGTSFTDALQNSIDVAANKFKGRAIHYVELGPEPMKTRHIIKSLMDQGVQIKSYVGVDINPASAHEMRARLSAILDEDKIRHRISLFENFNVDDIRDGDTPAIVTMLGFQEGNEEPAVMRDWMSRIASPGDCLLSEMQILDDGHDDPVETFYFNPLMQRFSRIAFERAYGDIPSRFQVYLIPVALEAERDILATVMCEHFSAPAYPSGSKTVDQIFVTNYCLKYTAGHYRQHREHNDQFKIINETITDDSSVVFQLSTRL